MKSIQVKLETWKKLKIASMDREVTIWKIVEELVDTYL